MSKHYSEAFALSKVESVVSDLLFELILHLVKIRLHPANQAVAHWTNEVDTWLSKIQLMVTNVKTPSGKVKEQALTNWVVPFASSNALQNMSRVVSTKYGAPGTPVDLSDMQARLLQVIPILLDRDGSISSAVLILTK